MVSHAPPEVVEAVAENANAAPVLAGVITWGSGLSKPNVVLKLSAGIDRNDCPQAAVGKATRVTRQTRGSNSLKSEIVL
jgi:hypothetical protein